MSRIFCLWAIRWSRREKTMIFSWFEWNLLAIFEDGGGGGGGVGYYPEAQLPTKYSVSHRCDLWACIFTKLYFLDNWVLSTGSGGKILAHFSRKNELDFIFLHLKVPKCEIFDPFFITSINPIWVGDLRTGEEKKFFRRLRKIFAILVFLRRLSLR